MNIMVDRALTSIEFFLKYRSEKDDLRELLLILKAELQVGENTIAPILAVLSQMFIVLMKQARELEKQTEKARSSNSELRSKVANYSKQVTRLNEKIQKFKSQENRFYFTIQGMYDAMEKAKSEEI
jgi:uncharacterized protein YlxW (UPF0749 family)